MINCIIVSKDRACQLDLLLRSMEDNFNELKKIVVLYKGTDPQFKAGYEMLLGKRYDIEINWRAEQNFKKDFEEILQTFPANDLFLCLCDDDVVIRPIDVSIILPGFQPDVEAISLKHAKHITYTYTAQVTSRVPPFIKNDPYLEWIWADEDPRSDWGYPSCLNTYIRRTGPFRKLAMDTPYGAPCQLEGKINHKRQAFKPKLISFTETKILNVVANRTQDQSSNKFAENEMSVEYLNTMLLDGFIIHAEKLYDYPNKSVNEEIEYEFSGC